MKARKKRENRAAIDYVSKRINLCFANQQIFNYEHLREKGMKIKKGMQRFMHVGTYGNKKT